MGEFSTLVLIIGFILTLVLYFVLKYRSDIALVVFGYSCIILSGVGLLISPVNSRGIFEVF